MAKNIGLIKISGKVGELQFFTKDGKTFVGLTTSLTKDRIAKDPAFKRTRENMAEFGAASKVSEALAKFLIPIKNLHGKGVHKRFVKLTRELMNVGSGARGKRAVEFSLNKEAVEGMELNSSTKLSEVIYIDMLLQTNADRNALNLIIEEFLPADYLNIPEGATHFKVYLAGLALSDYKPIGPKGAYKPVNLAQNGIFYKSESACLPVDSMVSGGINLTTALPNAPVLASDVSLVALVGIEFIQNVNGVIYSFASNNAVRIEKLF